MREAGGVCGVAQRRILPAISPVWGRCGGVGVGGGVESEEEFESSAGKGKNVCKGHRGGVLEIV